MKVSLWFSKSKYGPPVHPIYNTIFPSVHLLLLRPPSSSVTLRLRLLDSEMGWTGELWSKTYCIKEKKTKWIAFFNAKEKIFNVLNLFGILIFWRYWVIFQSFNVFCGWFFFGFFICIFRILRLILKVTKVTTEHQNTIQNGPKQYKKTFSAWCVK